MAIINCPECGKEVSDKAISCPNCGYGVKSHYEKIYKFEQDKQNIQKREKAKKEILNNLKNNKKIFFVVFGVMFILAMLYIGFLIYNGKVDYQLAKKQFLNGDLETAEKTFYSLNGYRDSEEYIQIIKKQRFQEAMDKIDSDCLVAYNYFIQMTDKEFSELNDSHYSLEDVIYKCKINCAIKGGAEYKNNNLDVAYQYFIINYKTDKNSYEQAYNNCKDYILFKEVSKWDIYMYEENKIQNFIGTGTFTNNKVTLEGTQSYGIPDGTYDYSINGSGIKTDLYVFNVYFSGLSKGDSVTGFLAEDYNSFGYTDIVLLPTSASNEYKPPMLGMTTNEVENSAWGKPDTINKTTYAWGTTEQWCYSDNKYVYFDNGIVTAISE